LTAKARFREEITRQLLLALTVGVVLVCVFSPGMARSNPCGSPPPPRFQPGQNSNYPQGADIITCSEPTPGHEIWHIDYPSVDRQLTDYPAVTFNPGDVVTLNASGCVQTGGFGNDTWKRYLNPDDDDGRLDSQYYGTVQITGVTGDNTPQSLKHWVGPPFTVVNGGHLALGYVDDGLGDNGYWNHDDGVNDQCVGQSKAGVDIIIDRGGAHLLDCKKSLAFTNTPVAPEVPELARVATLLTDDAEVPLGLPVTVDAQGTGIVHFQLYQDGKRGDKTTKSNRPLNSAEMHGDGCIYLAYTPTTSPIWYPAELAFDNNPQKSWQARPWDLPRATISFFDLEALNRNPASWLPTFLPGYCSGAGNSWRSTAPRWIQVCRPTRVPPSAWTPSNLTGFPLADPPDSELAQSGAVCGWQIKHEPSVSDGCVDFDRSEWEPVTDRNFRNAEGFVSNSFLSGGDYSGDHNGMPDGRYMGVHTDVETHNEAVQNCPDLSTADSGQLCADWELNLVTDANYRHLLARDESTLNDRDGGDCQSKHASEYRKGNQVIDIGGALGVEGEQWYYPVGYRPEAGDRLVARGQWIVDCGHPDWHTELHPASLLASSYLQTSDFAPSLGMTWNRPLRLTTNWRALTGGVPGVVTKIVASPVFAEQSLEVDVWPPARPNACARLVVSREDEQPNSLWSGVQFTENFLPADGNPNHLHVSITRNPFTLEYGGDGDVQNPDPHLTFFTAYMAWWVQDTCAVSGGSNPVTPPTKCLTWWCVLPWGLILLLIVVWLAMKFLRPKRAVTR
jgi:hypothetical protein